MPVDVLVGYDGSPEAGAAVDAGAVLFPQAHAWISYLWSPPFTSERLRRRLRAVARDANELVEMIDQEGEREATRLVATGVTLARAAGWDAEPLLKRTWGAEGLRFAQLTEQVQADVVLVGSRGLGGTQAVLGSVSDLVVRYATRPVLVVPHPLLAAEFAALGDGPVVVGWDGSANAQTAFAAAERLFPERDVLLVTVDEQDATPAPVDRSKAAGRQILTLNVEAGRGFHARATSDALIACANERNAAALIVGSRGRSVARDILLGSVAMGTLHHAHRPLMVVPSPDHWTARPGDE